MKSEKHHGTASVGRFGYSFTSPTYQFEPRPGDTVHEDGTVTRNGVRKGCYCDLNPGEDPTGCDLTEGHQYGCDMMDLPSGRRRMSPFGCPYWRKAGESST